MATVGQLSGRQRAAAMLVALGPETAGKVLQHLEPAEAERLRFEMINFGKLAPEVRESLMRECYQGLLAKRPAAGVSVEGPQTGERVSAGTYGPDPSGRVAAGAKGNGFAFLSAMEPGALADFLGGEHPQTIALIVAHLEPKHAGAVLARMEGGLQAEVATRIGAMGRTAPEVVEEIQIILRRRLSAVLDRSGSAAGGVECLVRILNQSDRATEKTVLSSLETVVPELAEDVRKRMFVFDDILLLDDRSVQRVLREVESKDLAVAMKTAGEKVRAHVMRNMSSRSAETLSEDIAAMGPVRARTVEEAQMRIVAVIRRLDEAEEIVISRGSDSDVVV